MHPRLLDTNGVAALFLDMCAVPVGEPNRYYDELVEALYGDSAYDSSLIAQHLRTGFHHNDRRDVAIYEQCGFISAAGFLMARGRVDLLRSLVLKGTPPIFATMPSRFPAHLDCDSVYDDAWWLVNLCSEFRNGYSKLNNPYWLALEHLGPGSLDMLKLAHEVCPSHAGSARLIGTPQNPGTLHYTLLHWALNGIRTEVDTIEMIVETPISGRMVPMGNVKMASDDEQAWMLECLHFMREARLPLAFEPGEPMDAYPFVTAIGRGARKEVLVPLLRAYVKAGLVDIEAPCSKRRPGVGGTLPFEAAILAGNTSGASALIEVGCKTSGGGMFARHGGSAVEMALDAGNPELASAVTEALMRRRVAETVTGEPATTTRSAKRRARSL